MVEDAPRHVEQLADERVRAGIAHRRPFLAGDGHALGPEHGELLGDRGLIEAERGLELLHAALAMTEDLEDANAKRVGERLEELGLEGLKVDGRPRRDHHIQYILVFAYSQ